MDQVSTLERLFRYKANSNKEILAAMRLFDDASPAKEIAIRVLSHTYVVDRIFAANLTGAEHGYTLANTSQAPSLEELSATIKTSDQWYIDYVSLLDEAQMAERIDFTFTDGEPGRMSREEMLWHVAIHGAGHRGQVGWIMTENSITPPADRFTSYYIRQKPRPGDGLVRQATRLMAISPEAGPTTYSPPTRWWTKQQRKKGRRCRPWMSSPNA